MKTSEKKIEEEELKDSSGETIDPYAVDFFGVAGSIAKNVDNDSQKDQRSKVTEKLKLKDIKGLDWYKSLPKFTYNEADFSNQLTELPNSIGKNAQNSVKKIFSRFTQLDEALITCDFVSISEVDLTGAISVINKVPQVYLTIQSNPSAESAIIAISANLASALIDMVLGGKGEASDVLRQLTSIEQTIIEFLAVNVFGDLNNNSDESQLSLQSVENNIQPNFKIGERGGEVILKFNFGDLNGNATLLLPKGFLDALGSAQKMFLTRQTPKQKFTRFNKISDNVALNIFMGETQVSANDILFLEKDDVILIEKPSQNIQEKIKAFVGDGTNYYLSGNLHRTDESDESDESDILSDDILLEVRKIFNEKDKQSLPKREKMDKNLKKEKEEKPTRKADLETQEIETEEANLVDESTDEQLMAESFVEDEIDEDALASLENVMINLRVNLGGRRLSLSELQQIRVGQIIELGCRPNDPVEVVTDSDNRPIATGELIEIEGQIGVRLTKILV